MIITITDIGYNINIDNDYQFHIFPKWRNTIMLTFLLFACGSDDKDTAEPTEEKPQEELPDNSDNYFMSRQNVIIDEEEIEVPEE